MPPRSPLSSRRDVVLHIGTGKAGSSSIQSFLGSNRERLAELDYLYPKAPGQVRHARLGLFAKSDAELVSSPEWYRQKQSDPARFRKVFRRRLLSEIEGSDLSRVLFSDEVLYNCADLALRRLRRFTDRIAGSLRLVVYLRRQDDHMVSRYQQGVKVGWVLRLDEWAWQEDMSAIYDHSARLQMWRGLLEPTGFVVRRFERGDFVDGSLYQDFLTAAGIDACAEEMDQVAAPLNESLDAESVEFLRLVNLYRVENEAATAGLIDNRRLIRRLTASSTGPTLTLPDPVLDEFMEQWEEPNEAVAREFLGDESGRLFHTPRKTRNTTVDQFFDPARLGHFLTVSDLPERMHAPLGALAEREARAR